MNVEQRLYSRAKQAGDDPLHSCWEWQGSRTKGGYGTLSVEGKQRYTHRLSWELFNGPIPAGLTIDHLCRNKPCINPWHMDPVTREVNSSRGIIHTWTEGRMVPANSKKTHCGKGLHEWVEENIYTSPKGLRLCAPCQVERDRIRYLTVTKPRRAARRQLNSEAGK